MDNNAIAIVLDALQRAASQNGEILKPAEQQLQSWEKEEGFYTVLMVRVQLCIRRFVGLIYN